MMSINDILNANSKSNEDYKNKEKKRFLSIFGLKDCDLIYIVIESVVSYEKMQQVRKMGCRWNEFLGWHSGENVNGIKMVGCNVCDICTYDGVRWHTCKNKVDTIRKNAATAILDKEDLESEFVGTIHAKCNFKLRLHDMFETGFKEYKSSGGCMERRWEYVFKDENNNVIRFSSGLYNPVKFKRFCGKKWLDVTAIVSNFYDVYGRKETVICYPEIVSEGKKIKDYAKINLNSK